VADLAAIGATILRWRQNICAFVHEELHVETIDAWQRDALEAFASPDPAKRRISLQACVGPGKSACLAWAALWFLGVQGDIGEHPKGAAVAVTEGNLRDNLWSELSKWMSRSAYLSTSFEWTSTRIFARDHEATWFLSARTWPHGGDPSEQGKTLSGLHSQYVLAIIDESGTIPPTVLRAAEQALSNCTFGKILQAGNPISTDGMLYAAAGPLRHQWFVVVVTGDPDDPKRAPRVDLEWAREAIRTYGRDNDWVKSYLLGVFPSHSFNTLLSVEDVEAAMHRHVREDAYTWSQKRIGVDCARFGNDATCLFPRQGLAAFKPVIMRGARTTEIAARVARGIADWGAETVFIDDTGGYGGGVVDSLLVAGCPAVPVNFSASPMDPRYRNLRAELWFNMAEWVRRGGALPDLPALVAELTQPTYTFGGGKFQLEEKDQIKKRLGRSPDLADALALTFALPDQPAALAPGFGRQGVGHVLHEWDPFAPEVR
jgi:hypothetical protein